MTNELQEMGQWKVGMEVLLTPGANAMRGQEICVVSRITDGRGGTVYIKSRAPGAFAESPYDIHGGQRGGDTWNRSSIEVLTESARQQFQSKNRRSKLIHFKWLELPLDQADMVVAFMREKGIKI